MPYLSITHFKKGDKVEVLKQENGPNTFTYYAATVLRSQAKRKTKTTQILVQYQTLMTEKSTEAQTPIKELVDLGNVRPQLPRQLHECFHNGDSVDVYCDNGWQKGTVKDVLENSKFVVRFDGKSEGIVAEKCHLRLHRDWDHNGSSWVPPLLDHMELPGMDIKHRNERLKIKESKVQSEPKLKIGTKVEVKSEEEGYAGAWFAAVIIGTIGSDKLMVQYSDLLTDDETAPLREIVYTRNVRPSPPPVPSDTGFKQFEKVDVWHNEAWWEGDVSEVKCGSKYVVYFRLTNETLEFDHSAVRHHQEWINGKWVQGKSNELEPNEETAKANFSKRSKVEVKGEEVGFQGALFTPTVTNVMENGKLEGKLIELDTNEKMQMAQFSRESKVEVRSEEVGLQGAWFAATIVDVMENGKFKVCYESLLTDDGTGFLTEPASAADIRPSPPQIEHAYAYRLFETVDAWYNDAWWVGRIVKVHSNSKYSVSFKTPEELEFAHSDLRPHQDWVNGSWVAARMDWGV